MTASRNRAACDDCGTELDVTAAGVGEWVTGFVVNREGGGANAVSAARRSGRYICRACVAVRRSRTRAVEQPQLFGSAS